MKNGIMEQTYQHNPNIVARRIAGEMILVPIHNNVADMDYIYTLNETAARVWELSDGERNLAEIHQALTAEFEVDPAEAQQDLLELIRALINMNALTEVDA